MQKKYAKEYFDRALSLAKKFEIKTTQGLAFLFDQAVQEWSFKSSVYSVEKEVEEYARRYYRMYKEDMPDFERLGVIVEYIRSTDGKKRRSAIRNGEGYVHGKRYKVENFKLSYKDKF